MKKTIVYIIYVILPFVFEFIIIQLDRTWQQKYTSPSMLVDSMLIDLLFGVFLAIIFLFNYYIVKNYKHGRLLGTIGFLPIGIMFGVTTLFRTINAQEIIHFISSTTHMVGFYGYNGRFSYGYFSFAVFLILINIVFYKNSNIRKRKF